MLAQPGTLRQDFASGGIFVQDISNEDEVQGIAYLEDGSFVMVGYIFKSNYNAVVSRVSSEGDLLWSKTINVSGNGFDDFFQSVVVIDNSIYVQANSFNNSKGGWQVVILKFDMEGELDMEYGENGRTSYFYDNGIICFEMEVDDDENIYIIGRTTGFFVAEDDGMIIKVNKDGVLDSNFGDGGYSKQSIDSFRTGLLNGMLINGEVYAAGWWHDTGTAAAIDENGVLIKVKQDGSRDLAFGLNGSINFDMDNGDITNDVVQHGENHFLTASTSGSPDNIYVSRHDLDGNLDETFGVNGKVVIDLGEDDDAVELLVRKDLGIYVCASVNSEEDFAIVSLDANGDVDLNFGVDGVIVVDIDGNDNMSEAVLLPNGDILLGGESNEDFDGDLTLVLVEGYITCSSVSVDLAVSGCGMVTYEGEDYSVAGIYPLTYQKADGCDSIVNLQVSILEPSSGMASLESCDLITVNGQVYTESGSYQQSLVNAAGCDSIVTLQVSILEPTSGMVSLESCDQITVNGEVYTESGSYQQTLVNAVGCDSTLTVNATVLLPSFETMMDSACEAFSINGETYAASGTFTQVLSNADGCDSTLTLVLEIVDVKAEVSVDGDTISSLSSGDSYQWIDCSNNEAIEGATDSTFQPEVSGEYALEVSNGECSSLSDCVSVSVTTSLEEGSMKTFDVFPNPTTGQLNIVGVSADNDHLEVYNMLGQAMIIQETGGRKNIILDVSELIAGTYILALTGQRGDSTSKRFVKTSK